MRYLRDDKRICWLEIYLKVYASSEPPLKCINCDNHYTLTQSGLCFYHPESSSYDIVQGVRRYACCGQEFNFSNLLCDGVQPNLLEDTLTVGCKNRFHRPQVADHKDEYNLLVPEKYIVIKDDTPGFHLNDQLHPNSENPKTLPHDYDYEVPLSLNAETNLSEFRQIEKPPAGG